MTLTSDWPLPSVKLVGRGLNNVNGERKTRVQVRRDEPKESRTSPLIFSLAVFRAGSQLTERLEKAIG